MMNTTTAQTALNKTFSTGSVWTGNAVALAYGGTGSSLSAVQGAVAYSGASGLGLSAAGTSGQVLVSGGTGSPVWVNASSLTTGTATVATTATNIAGGSAGQLIIQSDTGLSTFITAGASGTFLQSAGAGYSPTWAAGQVTIGSTAVALGATVTSYAGLNILASTGTSHWTLPAGTTAQRPGSPAVGMVRYNSDTVGFEGYSSGSWSSLGGVSSVDKYTYIRAETSAGASNGDLDFFAEDAAGTAAAQIGQWNRTNLKDYTGTIVGTQTTQNVFNATATTVNAFGASTATTFGATTGTHTIRNATVSLPNATAITTGQTTVALLNTTATTVNAFGAATTLSIGAATGTLTINNANTVITGNLTVNGTTTTINSTVTSVDDIEFELGSVASPTDITANGGGIRLKGATDKTINWSSIGWTSSEDFNLVTGKAYEINGTSVLSATTLGSGVTGSSLTSVGTIGTGVWQGTVVGATYGGTGVNNGANTLTMAGSVTHAGAFARTFTATATTSVTLPTTGTLATLAGSETLTNKTLTSPVIATIVNTGTLTLPTSTDTLIGRATTDTLTNKTLTSPVISTITNTGTLTLPTTTGTLALQGDTHYIGTTAVTLNRASANLALTGISSVTLPGSVSGTVQIIPTSAVGTGTVLTIPATTGTIVTTGDSATVTNTMLAGSIANAKLTNSTISGVALGGTLGTLTLAVSGTGLSGSATYTGASAQTFTVTSNATSANTASTIVARDASGNFTAGTITATLSGNATNISAYTINQNLGTANDVTHAIITGSTLRSTGEVIAYYSDDRLKTRTGNIQNALEKVLSLDGFHYHANETAVALGYDASKQEVGLSAQQVQAVLPEVIAPAPIDPQYMTMHYDRLVPLLVEAIKEQQKQIEELKARLG